MVASVHPLATDAGVAALRKGGNAIDAAIAVGLTLGVVDAHNSGLGGGCFILIRRADGKLVAIDGREMAPAKATRDMYLRDGKPRVRSEPDGPAGRRHAGCSGGYALAVKEHGKLKLADLVRPAAELAERGFPLDKPNASALARNAEAAAQVQRRRGSAAQGRRLALRRRRNCSSSPTWRSTYRGIAEQGHGLLLSRPVRRRRRRVDGGARRHSLGRRLCRAISRSLREPLVTTYRGRTIVGFPPPSSGGVHVAQILNILESFDVEAIHRAERGRVSRICWPRR